jgi:hypothetical protein
MTISAPARAASGGDWQASSPASVVGLRQAGLYLAYQWV